MEITIELLQTLCAPEHIMLTIHAAKRLGQRGIQLTEILDCIRTGEIIENYPDDYPFPSCLILGNMDAEKALHTVIGTDGAHIWIVTAYHPDPKQWMEDLKTRRNTDS